MSKHKSAIRRAGMISAMFLAGVAPGCGAKEEKEPVGVVTKKSIDVVCPPEFRVSASIARQAKDSAINDTAVIDVACIFGKSITKPRMIAETGRLVSQNPDEYRSRLTLDVKHEPDSGVEVDFRSKDYEIDEDFEAQITEIYINNIDRVGHLAIAGPVEPTK